MRYTSSPRDTPRAGAEQVATPALTPIALSQFLLPPSLDHLVHPPSLDPHLPPPHSLEAVPSVSDRDLCWPDLAECSRLLASHQLSRIFLSLTPRLRLEPWTLLYALSRSPGSYN